MATIQEGIDTIADELGIKRPVLGRYARPLRQAVDGMGRRRNLIRAGRVGGGKGAADFYSFDGTNLILSTIAQQPADAVAVVDELWTWIKGPNMAADGSRLPDQDRPYANLGEFIQMQIEELARFDAAARQELSLHMAFIRLCVDLEGGIAFLMDSGTRQFQNNREIFTAPWKNHLEDDDPHRMRRIVEVPMSVVAVAADLLADTLTQRGDLQFSPPGGAQTTAPSEDKTASDLARPEAGACSTEQRRGNGQPTGSLDSPEGSVEIGKSQGSSTTRACSDVFNQSVGCNQRGATQSELAFGL